MDENIKTILLNEQELNVQQFNIKNIDPSIFSILVTGKRNCGKSHVCKDLLKKMKETHKEIIISTNRLFYKESLQNSIIYTEYNSKILEELFNSQNIMKKNDKILNNNVMLVIDDCRDIDGVDRLLTNEPAIRELILNGRHYKIPHMITIQTPLGIKPELRANFNYIFLFAEDNITNLKRIYENFATFFNTFEDFYTVFKYLTTDYGIMVINNTHKPTDITNKIFWYKVSNITD